MPEVEAEVDGQVEDGGESDALEAKLRAWSMGPRKSQGEEVPPAEEEPEVAAAEAVAPVVVEDSPSVVPDETPAEAPVAAEPDAAAPEEPQQAPEDAAPSTPAASDEPWADPPAMLPPPLTSPEAGEWEDVAVPHPTSILRDAVKRLRLARPLPRCLTVHLKRFRTDARGKTSKISSQVAFTERLLLNESFLGTRPGSEAAAGAAAYVLSGVVVHSGGLSSGHYTSFVRRGGGWWHASDRSVRAASLEEVLGAEANLLFYVAEGEEGA